MIQKYHLLFVHGWGFSKHFWEPVSYLLNEFSKEYIDLGFVNNISILSNDVHDLSQQIPNTIAIGHSLGLLYLLKQFPRTFHHYIAINSFLRFSKAEDYLSGVPSRILHLMSKGIDKDVYSVLSQFYQQCQYVGNVPNQMNASALQIGLGTLETEDFRNVLPSITDRLTIVSSKSDPVVSSDMTIDSFKSHPIYWVKDNTHVLPISRPEICAKIIKDVALKS
ncbi:alpha/beta fold hydrolase [Commensalibacter communis]|uniref:alpha/beta fold hydrolase n=1 Tax=Commensalibacter communis TaxID=2972786 RepID=UPI0022FF703D|nr:alpha/beta hydrolase [Commensalibacter communis]CAI3935452.1 2-succinyl-6-hydroxy-2 [Commensalibacter communis]CAI3942705.1 2-succinyl-6-hydroxy-2 [Commensalibacter communis]